MCEREYEVIFKFTDIKKFTEFMDWVSQFDNKPQEPKVERRGSKTAELHRLAKEFQHNHPNYDYHTCMKLCKQVNHIPLPNIDIAGNFLF